MVNHSGRLLEKTPKNSLRVPFLAAAFPDVSVVASAFGYQGQKCSACSRAISDSYLRIDLA